MDKILVPIDFSEYSLYALEVAAQIAKKTEASIVILHMLGLSEAVLAKNDRQEHEEAKYYMNQAKKRFKPLLEEPFLKGIDVEIMLQNYTIFSELDQVAEENWVDLIVMGSHGNSGIGPFVVGSNTDKVIRTSRVPVLVIKRKHPSFDMDKMVFSTDLGEESIGAYRKAREFAERFSAELKVVFINLPNKDFKSTKEINKKIDVFRALASTDVVIDVSNDYSIGKGIMNFCERWDADLVIIPTRGRTGLVHFFRASIGEMLTKRSATPVLTIKI